MVSLSGCKDNEPKYDIYENHNISACGVNDPLINLDWLAEFTANYTSAAINLTICLYVNIETEEENIVMIYRRYTYEENGKLLETIPYPEQVYSCSGERLFTDSSGEPTEEWGKFFYSGKNEPREIIWYRIRIN